MARVRAAAAVMALIAWGTLATAPPAHATFPGTNGRIVFSTDWSPPSQIYTIRPDGAGLQQLTHVTTRKGATSPEWSHDGTRIAFVNDKHIWVMNRDGTEQTPLTSDEGFRDRQPAWSPDGTSIVFSHCDVSLGFKAWCDLDLVDADGGVETTLLGGNWSYEWPRYSPDGSGIAFSGDRDGYVCAVWVIDADGGNPVLLTDPAMQATSPDWSPDGSQLAFSTHCKLPAGRVWTMDPDGTDQQLVTDDPDPRVDWGHPRFAPDGASILVSGPGGSLTIIDLDGNVVSRIATPDLQPIGFDWGVKPPPPTSSSKGVR